MKYYSLKKILEKNAQYNMIIGERSNGKTYSVLEYGLQRYIEKGEQMAIIRRWQDDLTGKRGATIFDALVMNNEITRLTAGEWTGIYYYSGRWYLSRYTGKKRVLNEKPIAYAFSLTGMEHDKSTSYPGVTTVLFDEFLSRSMYLPEEFVIFMNVLSTIIRERANVKIFMLGNTVNKYCPYFAEMGLSHVKDMKPGDIDLYRYGDSDLIVAVEYTKPNKKGKDNDLYFAFDNPKLSMITGGKWEIDIYPHCPVRYKPCNIKYIYFIRFDDELLQCEVVFINNITFTFIHRKTTEYKDNITNIIYDPDYSPLPNHRRKITRPGLDIEKRIAWYFKNDKVFYQDNEVGEVVRNYLLWCNN